MSWSLAMSVAQLCLLVVLGAAVQRQRRYLPLFAFFAWFVFVNGVRQGTIYLLQGSANPRTGLDRVWLHVDQVLYLSVTFAFVWACGELFAARLGRSLALAGLGLCSGILAFGYPAVSGDVAGYVYTAAAVSATLACWSIALVAILHGTTVSPHFAHLMALILLGADTVTHLYAFVDFAAIGLGAFVASWDSIRAVSVLSFSASTAVCVVGIARGR